MGDTMTTTDRSVTIRSSVLLASAFLLALGATACGGAAGQADPSQTGVGTSALSAVNGLSPNGMSRNGMSRNGMSRNGMSRNGMSRNGLSLAALASTDFQAWFNEDPASSSEVMAYTVKCAAPAGKSFTWKNPATGVSYTWSGLLGLAPGWASGKATTTAEEQVITACLAAHVNKYGMHVDMSVLGKGATGVPILIESGELARFSTKEACFFGNVFADEGVFVGIDHPLWDRSHSSARACAFDILGVGPSADCPPINNVGLCGLMCLKDPSGSFYASCGAFVNGAWTTYLPITTRIQGSDVYTCGDGVCQFTESCGSGTTADSCQADCGVCKGTVSTQTSKASNKYYQQ
jgi:hypothetical protein